ncbi:MAG: AMP-binding protein [Cyanobacteria bacterium]|nr:AMP-binding protein [Cyanobacteriota bacterium]
MTGDQLLQAWSQGQIVPLPGPAPRDRQALAAAIGSAGLDDLERRWGPGVVLGSGGSSASRSGGRRWCLQPLAHLEASAAATGGWLEACGLEPARCLHLNALPLHHVSGLLPLVRSRLWRTTQLALDPAWLRDPAQLLAAVELPVDRPVLLSLVPTQLHRLMARPQAVAWLRRMAVIWIGGAPLAGELAGRARRAGLRLAPCYGATETAAMVCALPPEQFLAGAGGCGQPLADVGLRLDPASGAIELQAGRLSPGWLEAGGLRSLPRCPEGWWRSGDGGRWDGDGLTVLGRLDGALHSGGETVFPEQLEQRLLAVARAEGLALQALLLLARDDPEWGQQLVALVRPAPATSAAAAQGLLQRLAQICRGWAAAERPRRWQLCPALAPTPLGKWQRGRWRAWLDELEAEEPIHPAGAVDVNPHGE